MRLIDADALKHEIATIMPSRTEVFMVVDKMPDAVVRCKDCKYNDDNECVIKAGWFPVKPDWFCADGERKDSD